MIAPVAERLRTGRSFLLSTHVRIDGDAIGSVLALSAVLAELGKPHLVLLPDIIPEAYRFLPGADRAVIVPPGSTVDLPEDADTLVLVDAPNIERMGHAYDHIPENIFTIKIDHHQPSGHRADLELVDPEASSTAEIVHRILRQGGLPLTLDVAVNLYVAVLTDTGRFTLPNTTAECLRTCAGLVDAGVDPGYIGERLYRSYSPEVIGLWSDVAGSLRYAAAGQIAVGLVTQEMLARHRVHPADTQDFSDIPRSVRGVKVGVLLRERRAPLGGFRVSLRSAQVSIDSVARDFGGGGHRLAAGFSIEAPLEEAVRRIVDKIEPLLESHHEP